MNVVVGPDRSEIVGELTSLDRGLQVLAFVQDRGQVAVADIVAGLDLPSSTAYRYVRELKHAGFLVEVGGRLLPSGRLSDRSAGRPEHLVDVAGPVLGRLGARTGHNVALTVRVHTAALCLDTRRVGSGSVAFHPGKVLALYAGASATPLLAMAPPAVQRQVLGARMRRFTAITPDADQLRQELETVRRRGFHVSRGWLTPGMTAVGVPVMVAGGCLCALSLVGPDRDLADTDAAVAQLREAAEELLGRLPDAARDEIAWLPPDRHTTADTGDPETRKGWPDDC